MSGHADVSRQIDRLTVTGCTTDQIDRARRTCARHATSVDELRELLGMLGLLPGVYR